MPKFWVIFKLLAGAIVISLILFTAALFMHVTGNPIPFIHKLLPSTNLFSEKKEKKDFVKKHNAANPAQLDPGEEIYQQAILLNQAGKKAEATSKLEFLLKTYPASASAKNTRYALGDANLNQLLSNQDTVGKKRYTVLSGDSYTSIAAKENTSLECLIALNGLNHLNHLQPGENLWILPLHYRLVIDLKAKAIHVYESEKFIASFPVMHASLPKKTVSALGVISAKSVSVGARKISITQKQYWNAEKSILLDPFKITIRGAASDTKGQGILLKREDMEELFLLTLPGQPIELKIPKS